MLQLYELCRLCARKKRNKLDLFTCLNDEVAKTLLAKISLCLSVQVTREDLLPKMICLDCQRAVEQFSAFRVKCLKAEERLNKMLSLAVPNKLSVTSIKEECLEADSHENTDEQVKPDSSFSEPISFINLVTVKNVKSEIEEVETEVNYNQNGSDLIQIISEEIVSRQLVDVKQPQIEIISEELLDDMKNANCSLNETNLWDSKMVPETFFRVESDEGQYLDVNLQSQDVIVKPDSQEVQPDTNKKEVRCRRKPKKQIVCSDDEIDEKYLTLKEGEVCDIDLEEMDALIKKKQNPETVFKCDKCNKSFKFFKCLRKHKRWHESQPDVFICDYCKTDNVKNCEFSSWRALSVHIQKKHLLDDSKFKCNLCKKVMSSQDQLDAHLGKVHQDTEVSCQICGKMFQNKARLNCHLKVHQEERPYVCDYCNRSFKWRNAFKFHIQSHNQEKNFLCSECGKKLTTKQSLIEHLNTHTGKRPYVCEECNASFVHLSAYTKHLSIHNKGKRVHKCDKCDKSFGQAHMLKLHLVRHSGLRPYECTICHHTFKSLSYLSCHTKIHQEKQHGCHVCGKKFTFPKTLREHMVKHTGIKHRCPAPGCGKTYTQRFSLTQHFCKKHPMLNLVRKRGGKKSHLAEKESTESDFIRYDFIEKMADEHIRVG